MPGQAADGQRCSVEIIWRPFPICLHLARSRAAFARSRSAQAYLVNFAERLKIWRIRCGPSRHSALVERAVLLIIKG
jgi:hypothetical protein